VTPRFHHWHHAIEREAIDVILRSISLGSTGCSAPTIFRKTVAGPAATAINYAIPKGLYPAVYLSLRKRAFVGPRADSSGCRITGRRRSETLSLFTTICRMIQ